MTSMVMCGYKWATPVLHRITSRGMIQASSLHTAMPLLVAPARNTKKKIIKPVKFGHKKSKKSIEVVTIEKNMTVSDLAKVLGRDNEQVFEALGHINDTQQYNTPKSMIQNLDVIKKVVSLSGFRFKIQDHKKAAEIIDKDVYPRPPPTSEELVRCPPVVAIMGHVDHGKTTLLDALRHSNIVSQEFGGITQHIGAFTVALESGEEITFLDTPGHAAFHAMRARGAHATDIVVLVVAADDGVMKQTLESIKHAHEAKVPIIVALNKIDKPEADIEGTKRLLMQSGLHIEDYGGDIQVVPVSALKGLHLDNLQESIVALSEIQEIKGDPTGLVEGVVIESKMDTQRGKLSTALVQRGTLKRGSYLVAGEAWAKVRAMFNDQGKPVHEGPPGTAVELLGWRELPHAGQQILQVDNEKRVHEVISYRKHQTMSDKADKDMSVYNAMMEAHNKEYQELRKQRLQSGRISQIYRKMRTKEEIVTHTGPELAVVVKGDVDGSVEAILDTLDTYNSDKCRLHILSYGVGDVTSHDVDIAGAFNGIIYAFNTGWNSDIKQLADKKGVKLQRYNVIYKMIDHLREKLQERLPKVQEEEILGEANVLQLFQITEGKHKIAVAGCRCVKGLLHKKHSFRLVRNGEIILTDRLDSMKHFKNEVDTVKTDVECGLSFRDKSVDPQSGDLIVCYTFKEITQKLDWDLEF